MTELDCPSVAYLEQMLADFQRDPASVPDKWRDYFRSNGDNNGRVALGTSLQPRSIFHAKGSVADGRSLASARLQDRVSLLIRAYRVRGHLAAKLDPLGFVEHEQHPELELDAHGLSEADLDREFSATTIGGPGTQSLREIVARLRTTYCRSIGVQFMHIDDLEVRDWLAERMERTENRLELSRAEQLRILRRLTDAVMFEEFTRKKYVGAKTFSLEGSESLIPLLDLAIERAAAQGIDEIVIGMAHRGRLNVLANIIGKTPQEIFYEFEDVDPERYRGSGDVRYHLGFSGDWSATNGRNVHLSLCFNPSHLEYVSPVALGRMRAKQDRARTDADDSVPLPHGMVILIHGDASFAGEGVVQETLNLSELSGYTVGGTLHVVVNNQIGFTTSPQEGRSTVYATDVARMLQIPIFHVNGEDPEAVAQVVTLAMNFRAKFQRDVVIDMYGFRRWGHNEGDEPGFTQPMMYHAIEHRESVRDRYLEHLLELGGVTREEADRIAKERHAALEQEFDKARAEDYAPPVHLPAGIWKGYTGGREPEKDIDTGVPAKTLSRILTQLTGTPDGFHLHRKLKRSMDRRQAMADGQEPLDWSAGEALAIATLAVERHRVRIAGQDSERGTFSHRHSVLHDVVDGGRYSIFSELSDGQAAVEIINSPLCESGTLGFEFGYSLDYPEALVAWEAQFGDFSNAGQVIIDQFIASSEDKWNRLSGVTLLLPHGFEGQGPEHSSARLERFLTLAGDDNMQIVVPTTPAQYFHVLRRQVRQKWRKPLVVLTPKSLLRHPMVVSPLADLAKGTFLRVLGDERPKAAKTKRVLLCSGKLYYDLSQYREDQQRTDVAIVRIEQLYPLPERELCDALSKFAAKTPVVWVQEEPENMGAWTFWRRHYCEQIFDKYPFEGVTRPESASPATGSSASHKREQEELIEQAFGP